MRIFKAFSLSVVLLSMILTSCNSAENESHSSSQDSNVEALKKEVIGIHDEVMPKLGLLGKLAKDLRALPAGSEIDSSAAEAGAKALMAAKDGMMNWMHEFKHIEEQDWTEEEKIAYLEGEKLKIQEVKDMTEAAITEAKGMLK